MDTDRVRAYLQVACAGLGFEIGEVWWMSNETGTSTVASIEESKVDSHAHDHDSGSARPRRRDSRKRFMQLYTSKAYDDQRSKLRKPEMERETMGGGGEGESSQLRVRRNSYDDLDDEHVLSPRIVDAVTNSAQVVWANCQKQEGLLGRSDIKLQTAIGMPVGVDENGNVWVVVMFSPKSVDSNSDAIDYLQYISRSASSASIPCLLPVVHMHEELSMRGQEQQPKQTQTQKHKQKQTPMIGNGGESRTETQTSWPQSHQHHSLVALKPNATPRYATQDLGEGVTAQFVSLLLDDNEDGKTDDDEGLFAPENDLDMANAPQDHFGIPMLPTASELNGQGQSDTCAADNSTFDDASYGVWSTIMNSPAAGDKFVAANAMTTNDLLPKNDAVASKLSIVKERLEEFASAFLGMSVFDVADAWVPTNGDDSQTLDLLFSVAPAIESEGIHGFRQVSARTNVGIGSGAIGRAFSLGYPVWSNNQECMFDDNRMDAFQRCEIKTIFAVPIFSAGAVLPACILSCYSVLRIESVPFVLKFVQKAVRLLWDGLHRVVDPHESVGQKLWNDVAPAHLGEMAADVEMQKAFIGIKRRHDDISTGVVQDSLQVVEIGTAAVAQHTIKQEEVNRDRSSSLTAQMESLPSLAPSPHNVHIYPIQAPPLKGLAPAPTLPTTVQKRRSLMQESGHFISVGQSGHWAVQQAVRSVGHVVPWENRAFAPNPAAGDVSAGPLYVSLVPNPIPAEVFREHASGSTDRSSTDQAGPTSDESSALSQLAYVDYSSCPITPWGWGGGALQPNKAPSAVLSANPAPDVYVEDPAVIRANINEFNALARLHVKPPSSGVQSSTFSAPTSFATNPVPMSTGNSSVIPGQFAGGSIVVKGPQSVYCVPLSVPLKADMCVSAPTFASQLFAHGKNCRIQGCDEPVVAKRPYCLLHCGNRQCEHEGCAKCAQGATRFCIAHGGGRRCTVPGCDKGARDKFFCAAHGGGKRCKIEGCSKSAVGGSTFCTSHGGGRRCHVDDCNKSAQSSTNFCVKHGGGKKCQREGCEKVSRGRTQYCAAHGGGVRCKLEGCNRVSIGKAQLCRAHGGGTNMAPPRGSCKSISTNPPSLTRAESLHAPFSS